MSYSSDIKAGAAFVEIYVKNFRLMRGLRAAKRKLIMFGETVGSVGRKLTALSAAMILPMSAGVKVFADFETQMAKVSTMLDEPEKYMKKYQLAVRAMSVEFGESTETLAAGLYDILSASIPTEKALGVLAVSARAAKAGMTDTAIAADAITTILNAYKLKANPAGAVSDLLFSIVKKGKTTFPQIAASIGMVATTAASAGVSLDELGASIATMTRNGVKTENAITAVTAIISGFLKPSKQAADYANQLGFELSASTLEAQGLQGIFQKISKLPADSIAKLFPNIRALRGVLPALKNMKGFAGDLATMKNKAGATETAYQKMSQTLDHSFSQIKQAAIGAFYQVGVAISGSIKSSTDSVLNFIQNISRWISQNQNLVLSIAKIVLVSSAVGIGLIILGSVLKSLAVIFGVVTAAINIFILGFKIAALIISVIISPIGLVIGAFVALGAVLLTSTKAGGKVLKWFGEKFTSLGKIATVALDGIKNALASGNIPLAAKILWTALKLAFKTGTKELRVNWVKMVHGFKIIWAHVWHAILNIGNKVWHGIVIGGIESGSALKKAWAKTSAFFKVIWAKIKEYAAKAWNKIKGIFKKDFDVKKANQKVELEIAEEIIEIEKKMNKDVDQAEAKRKRQRKRENQRQAIFEKVIADQRDKDINQAVMDGSNEIRKINTELKDLQNQLDKSVAKAKSDNLTKEDKAPEAHAIPDITKMQELIAGKIKTIESASPAISSKVQAVKSFGTFRTDVLSRSGLNNIETKQLDQLVEINLQNRKIQENTKKTIEAINKGGLKFG